MLQLLIKLRQRRIRYLLDNSLFAHIRNLLQFFIIIVLLHILAMHFFEDLSWFTALWLTMTTVTTVGYGDISAQTPAGQISTMLLLYAAGIFILAQMAGHYFDYRIERRERMLRGYWRWNMQDHIVIINAPQQNYTSYFLRLCSQLRDNPEFQHIPIQILTQCFPDGLPQNLRNLGIQHIHGRGNNNPDLEMVNIDKARYIIVIARQETDSLSDSINFDILHRLQNYPSKNAFILAECVNDSNRQRLTDAGADALIRPMRAYPELIIRALVAPGSERVLENLFTHDDNHNRRYDIAIQDLSWADIVCKLMQANQGTAMAYINDNNEVITHPLAATRINAKALIIMVKETHIPTLVAVQETLLGCNKN